MHLSRTFLLAVFLLSVAAPAASIADQAKPAEQPASAEDALTYGTPVTVKKAVSIAKLEKKPGRFTGKTVRLEGVVKDVCQGQGCWIEVADAKGNAFLAKSLDESVLVPTSCKGMKVVVQGVVTQLMAKGHEGHAHEAVESGHACPTPKYVVATRGVELKP
jgi:hypothetical protein